MSTPHELYTAAFQNPHPTYYAMVPHIVDHLTYNITDEDGKVVTKRLSPLAIHFYRILIRIAGEEGACWMNRDNLADLCNMSAGSITNAKKELLQNFNELGGGPLIILSECKKANLKDGQMISSTVYHKMTVCDIWRYNNAYNKTKKLFASGGHCHQMTAPPPTLSPNDGAPQGALSPGDTIKNTNKKNPLFKEQQPAAEAASVCSLDQAVNSVLASEAAPPPEIKPPDQKTQAFNWMMKYGFDERAAMQILAKHTIDDISLASQYVIEQAKKRKEKNETIANQLGYFVKTIEGRWWRQKKT